MYVAEADSGGGGGGGGGIGVGGVSAAAGVGGGVNDCVEQLESLLSLAVCDSVLSDVDVDEDGLCG